MVRTSNTAKKSTGGKAVHVSVLKHIGLDLTGELKGLTTAIRARTANEVCPKPPIESHDGGDLWICDTCPRVFCNRCVVVDAKYLTLVAEDGVVFVCVSCHWLKTRRGNSPSPYY
ncbi:hypothetical protein PAXRUDRAFT_66011, partial [Paxillus rubicundulus Ve08.2h10]